MLVRGRQTPAEGFGVAVDALVDLADDVPERHVVHLGADVELVGTLDGLVAVRVVEQLLRGDAVTVETRPGDSTLLDDRDGLALVRGTVRDVQAGPGAEDHEVVLVHIGSTTTAMKGPAP